MHKFDKSEIYYQYYKTTHVADVHVHIYKTSLQDYVICVTECREGEDNELFGRDKKREVEYKYHEFLMEE